MTSEKNTIDNLSAFIKNTQLVDTLESLTASLQHRLDCYETNIEFYEDRGLLEAAQVVTEEYNKLNKWYIQLKLILLDIQYDILKFELKAATRD